MKTMKLIALMFLVLGMASCKNESSTNIETKDDAFKTMTAKEIVESGVPINVTIDELEDMEREAVSRNGGEERPLWAIPAYRAAHYRFYQHLTQDETGVVSWSAKSGADLNISEDLFNGFVQEAEWINERLTEYLNSGNTENLHPIFFNDEYLSNVINDEYVNKQLEFENTIKMAEKNNWKYVIVDGKVEIIK